MSTRETSPRTVKPPPSFPLLAGLTQDLIPRFEGLGRRLAAEIRALTAAIPIHARTVRAMADHLGVNRNLCQRAIAAANGAFGGLEVIARSPGFAQMRAFAEAAAAKRVDPVLVRSLRAAIQEIADLAVQSCGSESRFRAALRDQLTGLSSGVTGESNLNRSRRELFQHASVLAGCSSDLRVGLGIAWPSRDNPKSIDLTMVTAYRSFRCREGGMPLTMYFRNTPDESGPVEGAAAPRPLQFSRPELLSGFCSDPIPFVSSHGLGAASHVVISPYAGPTTRFVDVAIIHQIHGVEHPGLRPSDPHLDVLLQASNPIRHLVYDFYLHESLARQSIPFFGAFVLGLGFDVEVRTAWYRQVPEGGQLELLGAGLRNAGSRVWDRHAEMVRHVFDRLNLPADQAIGYRADIAYPLWGITYAVGFDFTAKV